MIVYMDLRWYVDLMIAGIDVETDRTGFDASRIPPQVPRLRRGHYPLRPLHLLHQLNIYLVFRPRRLFGPYPYPCPLSPPLDPLD